MFDSQIENDWREPWGDDRQKLVSIGVDSLETELRARLRAALLSNGPMVVHGVQHLFHPPMMLPRWPSAERRTRIVFIVRDIDETELLQTLDVVREGLPALTEAASENDGSGSE